VTSPFCSCGSSHWMTMVEEERGRTCTLRGADPGPVRTLVQRLYTSSKLIPNIKKI
jgi:hypothetical protein